MLSSSKKPKTECIVNGAGTVIKPWVLKLNYSLVAVESQTALLPHILKPNQTSFISC